MKNTENYMITKYPNAILRKKATKVQKVTDDIRDILKKMLRTMYTNQGIGLAAQQVGLDIQVAVVDAGEGVLKIINPVILDRSGDDVTDEGCLSLPATLVTVKRARNLTLQYQDEWGKVLKRSFSGLTAKAIQHELDHLNGQLIIDYLPWFKKMVITRQLKNL